MCVSVDAGLGTDNLMKVKCDHQGQMLPDALDDALSLAKEQGKVRACLIGVTQLARCPAVVTVTFSWESSLSWHQHD